MLPFIRLVVVVTVGLAACTPPPEQQTKRTTTTTTTPPTTSTATTVTTATTATANARPPHPKMATADWGEHVAARLQASVPADVLARADDALTLINESQRTLLSLEPGAEQRAVFLAAQGAKIAKDDVVRGLGFAVAAAALVLDPTVEGYGERLVDASGLAIYAGTLDASDATGQSARALVGAAGGNVLQAKTLIRLVSETPALADEKRVLLAVARDAVRDHSDAFFSDARLALQARPEAMRLRLIVADLLLEFGFVDAARDTVGTAESGALQLLSARIELAAGHPERSRAILVPLIARWAGVDEPRRAEALFWLGIAGSEGVVDLGAVDEAIVALDNRPGWKKEAALLRARRLRSEGKDGFVDAARALLLPMVKGTPTSTITIERMLAWELIALCRAAAPDAVCEQKATARLRQVDVVVESAAGDANVAGGDVDRARLARESASAAQLLAVRRALASNARSVARPTLDELVKEPTLRAARAVRVSFAKDPGEAGRFAVAAVQGEGPLLGEDEMVVVVAALGGWKGKDVEAALVTVQADTRPRVVRAMLEVQEVVFGLSDGKQRLAGEHTDTVVPSSPEPPRSP